MFWLVIKSCQTNQQLIQFHQLPFLKTSISQHVIFPRMISYGLHLIGEGISFADLPPVRGPWPEAATASSRRSSAAPWVPCGTSCRRSRAPWPRGTASWDPPRCMGRRSAGMWRSAGCCWRRGPRWTPGTSAASRP